MAMKSRQCDENVPNQTKIQFLKTHEPAAHFLPVPMVYF